MAISVMMNPPASNNDSITNPGTGMAPSEQVSFQVVHWLRRVKPQVQSSPTSQYKDCPTSQNPLWLDRTERPWFHQASRRRCRRSTGTAARPRWRGRCTPCHQLHDHGHNKQDNIVSIFMIMVKNSMILHIPCIPHSKMSPQYQVRLGQPEDV